MMKLKEFDEAFAYLQYLGIVEEVAAERFALTQQARAELDRVYGE